VPWLVTASVLALAGVFDRFWFWTVRYAAAYATRVPLAEAPAELAEKAIPILASAPLLWVLAGVGIAVLPRLGLVPARAKLFWIFLVASVLAVSPGWLFREHYFLLLLPAASIAVGAAATRFRARTGVVLGALALAVGVTAALEARPWFRMSPPELSRFAFGPNPFVESQAIAAIVRERTDPGDRVAILGSEPQIPFLAGRRSATGYLYTYPLMEDQPFARAMQQEMIAEIEAAGPRVVVFVHVDTSWLRHDDSPTDLFEWLTRYLEPFRPVAAFEIRPDGTRVYTGADLAAFDRDSEFHVTVFERVRR
jgi:hypothetical protein